MKNLCSKSKPKKVHPSPSAACASAAAAIRLLPAAILALTAVLSPEDKEVLAYLVMRSVGASQEQGRKTKRSGGAGTGANGGDGGPHAPVIGCGCFDCYTSFWSRWDQSPNRELIHAAIDAFDDHLANSEAAKNKKGAAKRAEKGSRVKPVPEVEAVVVCACQEEEQKVANTLTASADEEDQVVSDDSSSTERKVAEDGEEAEEAGGNSDGEEEEEELEERRKGYWSEVMGNMLNLRLWGIWSSAPPAAAAMDTA